LLRKKADWNAKAKWMRTALHIASSNQGYEIALRLLDTTGIDINAEDEHCETPLHIAVRN
jgi:ankyrin repeat protein